ncbi:MAG: hypothetical protein R3B70_45690 [Polyangiaceae bacterium]
MMSVRSFFACALSLGLSLALTGCEAGGDSSFATGGAGGGGSGGSGGTSAGGGGASTGGAPTTTSDTGGTTTGTPTGTTGVSCADLPLCDGFEGASAGGPPDPALWAVVSPNCSGAGTVTVDSAVAHTGNQSLRVDGKGGYCDHVFIGHAASVPGLGDTIFGRFHVRFSDALGQGHTTFLAMKDAADGGKDLRMGGQNGVLMYNRESDDATLPVMSPAGTATSMPVAPGEWTCIEFQIDAQAGTLHTWVNGAPVAGLTLDETPTPDIDQPWITQKPGWKPDLEDLRLGWESYAGQSMTLWIDDVALAPQKLGCD